MNLDLDLEIIITISCCVDQRFLNINLDLGPIFFNIRLDMFGSV